MVILKLQLGEEIRRLSSAPQNLQEVKQKVFELFGVESSFFRYKDTDGDLVKIDSQEEYEEALVSHSVPFKLEVIDAISHFPNNSTILKTEMGQEVHICNSFADSFIYTDDNLIAAEDPKQNKVETADKQLGIEKVDSSCQVEIDTETKSIEIQQELQPLNILKGIIAKHCVLNQPGTVEIGVRCFHCKLYIYDIVFKCPRCPSFYICDKCESNDSHSHPLFKSRKKVNNSSATGNVSLLLNKLQSMGFSDKDKNMTALIQAKYNVEAAIQILLY